MMIKNKNLKFVLLLTVFIVVVGILSYLYANHTANIAEKAAKPLNNKIEAIGGKLICSEGNNGRGLDNYIPWHESYYYLPQSQDLETNIKDTLKLQSINLISTQQFMNQFGAHGHGISIRPGDYEDKTKNSYFIHKSDEDTVEVNIIRDGKPNLRCPYNARTYTPTGKEDGTTIIEIMWRK